MSWLTPVLVLLAILGAPLFALIAASALWSFYQADIDLQVVAIEFWGIAEMPILLAIPLFTFAGYLLSESQAPQRLVRLTTALIGWMPAGLAIVALAACAFFTAFTGASGVTIVALGAILFPAMQQAGYGDRFNLGLVTSAGSLGLLFAPSLPLIDRKQPRLHVGEAAITAFQKTQLGQRIQRTQGIVEQLAIVENAGLARPRNQLVAKNLIPQRLDFRRLGKETMATYIEAKPLVLFRPRNPTHVLGVALQHGDLDASASKMARRGQASRTSADADDMHR